MMTGRLLNERYKIIRKIGSGGMADVYLARDTILERDVAIKALRPEYVHDAEFTARFDREAQAATSLTHPNIVNIYDVGEDGDVLYMVMEYIDGLTLKEYIKRYGPIDVQVALDILKQIASAIAHAHENDIVHRDIKPQNILIDKAGQAKVTDFGIAIALSATALTQTNSILGSVHYLSPEQARGGMATKKSDIYSIGIVFYELLTGRLPFSGQSAVSIALKHLQNETPSVRRFNQDIPQSVENIVLKATAKDPFHRYMTIYELEKAIEDALHPDKLNEQPYKPPEEVGDETKAIPIITDDQFIGAENQDTIISKPNGNTKSFPENKENGDKNAAEKKQEKPKKKRKWLIIFITFIALLGISIAALFFIPGLLGPKDVMLPNVIEWEYEEARDELESLNLTVEKELVFSDDVEEGYVVRMSPGTGRTVKEETTVTLSVSEGKERVVFEDYTGRDISQVTTILESSGFEVITIERYSDRPSGEIIEQVQPSPDAEVVPSETKVIFEVSIGPELISLNNLTGMTLDETRAYLEKNDLLMQVHEEHSDTLSEGRVIRQSPSTGTELEKGSTVNVYVSIGPEEIPPASYPVSFIVPYTGEAEVIETDKTENEEAEDEDGTDENEAKDEEADSEETLEPAEQIVRIFIDDMNNNISNVYEEIRITEDTEVTFTLLIAPGEEAEYMITRDDDIVTSEVVPYEEGE